MKSFNKTLKLFFFIIAITVCCGVPDKGLIGHWHLSGNTDDISGNERNAVIHGNIDLRSPGPAGSQSYSADFNGKDAWLEIPADKIPSSGNNDFSISVWIYTEADKDDVTGDIISQYDPSLRKGFQLSIKDNYVLSSYANSRQLCFGIDDNLSSEWIDCGRPGNAVLARSMAVHDGRLYTGTLETGRNESGRVYYYANHRAWIDCGSPDNSNSIMALASFKGSLFAATGRYRTAGSSLPDSENKNSGGRIYRYNESGDWIYCGRLPLVEAIGGMVVYRGELYATSYYAPASFYRYKGDTNWVDCGIPTGGKFIPGLNRPDPGIPENKRVVGMSIYNGCIYASSLDGGIYRYNSEKWTDCGLITENTQTYGLAVYEGKFYTGTWPSGRVYRFEDLNRWTDVGRLGNELEVMGMVVHNGRLIAGTLPLAEVYSYEGDTTWKKISRLDLTPEVKYHRAWTMAEHDGKVFCSTLPSGRIFSFEAGRSVMWEKPFPEEWHHIAAIKTSEKLILYMDGKLVAESSGYKRSAFNLTSESPLKIGFGPNDYFLGRMADLRFYNRKLSNKEIKFLTKKKNINPQP